MAASGVEIAKSIEDFLTRHPRAVLLEDGRVLFDLQSAKYTLQQQADRCTLQLWSEDRNLSRRIVSTSLRKDVLRLGTLRFGQTKPQTLELAAQPDRRTPSVREGTRKRFLPLLERVLLREFPEWKLDPLQTAMDLERSFGPAYARGVQHRGQLAWAVVAVNAEESTSTVDGILTIGILWLQLCRERAAGKRLFQGLRLIVPGGTSAVTLSRLAWLRADAAQWQLHELDQRTEELTERDPADTGNLVTRLLHAPDPVRAAERFAPALAQVRALIPPHQHIYIEERLRTANELALLLHGLEFARVRQVAGANSFAPVSEITFGTGASETSLTSETENLLRGLVTRLFERRHATGSAKDPLFRMAPEAWLESELRRNIQPLTDGQGSLTQFDPAHVYAQVPAFQAGDRGMLDLLTATGDGRLAVLELKADEDLHFALQGLDYWLRVRWHHTQTVDSTTGLGTFQQHGYFTGLRLSPAPPRLFLVAPSLRIHPATEQVLRYLKPEVEWTLLGLDERWRSRMRVVVRKRSR